jgi:hypothetical protein
MSRLAIIVLASIGLIFTIMALCSFILSSNISGEEEDVKYWEKVKKALKGDHK